MSSQSQGGGSHDTGQKVLGHTHHLSVYCLVYLHACGQKNPNGIDIIIIVYLGVPGQVLFSEIVCISAQGVSHFQGSGTPLMKTTENA